MIIEIRISNYLVFSNEVQMSLQADMRSKKLSSNVHKMNNFNVLKTVGVYGQNNVGKSCFVKAIREIKNVMLNKENKIQNNIFTDSPEVSLGMTFLYKNEKYSYDFKYNVKDEEYTYEKFTIIERDYSHNEKERTIFLKDSKKSLYFFANKRIEELLSVISQNNIMIYQIDSSKFHEVDEIKDIFINFSVKIDILFMTNIPINKTIDLLKNENDLQTKVVDFIKNADLDLDDYYYASDSKIKFNLRPREDAKPDENILNVPEKIMDQIKLTSLYKGHPVPSLLFDSTGTKKIVALSSYIIDAIENGRILIVDELDSGLHFKLTRAIVAMFNNELNKKAQMIFTVHDINLMDCKKLLRKEQVYFISKDNDGAYMYSLSDFTAQDGVRDTSDVISKYRKGLLGSLPEPTLINTLLQLEINDQGDKDE